MRKTRILLILGAWIALLPYLGFPYAWKTVLFTLSGLFAMYLSYDFSRHFAEDGEGNFENFRENRKPSKKGFVFHSVRTETEVVEIPETSEEISVLEAIPEDKENNG